MASGNVADIAARFAGPSRPTPENELQAIAASRERQRQASQDSQASRHAYRSKGNEFMSEFERLRRLEAEARRRAEEEARRNLHRYNGIHALILALERLKLGLPLTTEERKLVEAHAAGLQLQIAYSPEDIRRAQEEALEASIRQEESLLAQSAPGSHGALPTVAHSIGLSQSTVLVHDGASEGTPSGTPFKSSMQFASPTEAIPQPGSGVASQMSGAAIALHGRSTSEDATAMQLLALMRDTVAQAQRPLSLAELYDALTARMGQTWGALYESRYGSLHGFLLQYGRSQGLGVHGELVVLLDPFGEAIIPIDSLPPAAGGAVPPHGMGSWGYSHMMMSGGAAYPSGYPGVGVPPPGWYPGMPGSGGMPMTFVGADATAAPMMPGVAAHGAHASIMSSGTMYSAISQTPTPGHAGALTIPRAAAPAPAAAPVDALSKAFAQNFDPFSDSQPGPTGTATAGAAASAQKDMTADLLGLGGASGAVAHRVNLSTETTQLVSTAQQAASAEPSAFAGRRTTRERMGVETVSALSIEPSSARRASAPAPAAAVAARGSSYGRMSVVTQEVAAAAGAAGRRPSPRRAVRSPPVASPPRAPSAPAGGRFLDVEEMAQRAVSRGLCDGDDNLTWQDFDVLFRPILVHGFSLIKHGRHGPAKRRRFWMTHQLNRLYWETGKFLDLVRTGERHLDMIEVVNLIDGPGTDLFRRKIARGEVGSEAEGRLFSLITTTRTLDLEAMSVAQRKVLVRAFNFLVRRLSRPRLMPTVRAAEMYHHY